MATPTTKRRPPTMAEQIADRCRHFTGIQHERCSARVHYKDVRDATQSGGYRWPCFKDRPATTTCAKASFPTPEEVAAEVRESEDRFARIATARAAIVASKKKSGTIDCPCCGKPEALRFSVSPYNGHVHAACTSKGCVSWME